MSIDLLAFRSCLESDLAQVEVLMRDLYLHDYGSPGIHAEIKLTFAELKSRPDKGGIIVFTDGKTVIGYAIIIFFWSNEYQGNIIEIDELCIDADHRGGGLATKFFSWLENEYGANAVGLSLQVGHTNAGAAKLYDRLGFKLSRNAHLFKQVPAPLP